MSTKWSPQSRAMLSLALSGVVTSVSAAAQPISPASPGSPMKPDQVNTAPWQKAWTNLVNDAEQTFTPSLPRLLAVEVEMVVANPGSKKGTSKEAGSNEAGSRRVGSERAGSKDSAPEEDDLTLTVLDASGETLASLAETVYSPDCDHLLFVIPKGGIEVTPGQTYRLKLTGGMLFGWKYVVGGYEKGAATFNGRALLPNARSTFLFRTFGAE